MPDNSWWDDPWQLWRSWLNPGSFAHPDAAGGGGGTGFGHGAQPIGRETLAIGVAHPHSPAGRREGLITGSFYYLQHQAETAIQRITRSNSWKELRFIAEMTLGPTSFGLGVCYGIVRNPASSVGSLLELQKTFILADLYDRMTSQRGLRLTWGSILSNMTPGSMIFETGATVLMSLGVLQMRDLEAAHKQRDALVSEIKHIFADPVAFFKNSAAKVKQEYIQKWQRFIQLSNQQGLRSQFQAGEILGDVLVDVVMLVLTVVDGVGIALKLADEVPELVRLARGFKQAIAARRAGEGTEAIAGAGGGAAAGADSAAASGSAGAAAPKPKSLREQYLGRTPGKNSRTGQQVQARMQGEGALRNGPNGTEFKASDGEWYPLNDADMAHNQDAVTWWNQTGRQYGPKSPQVRQWMLDPNNYTLDHYSINRSAGAQLPDRYLPPQN